MRSWKILGVALVVALAAGLELFYFRFHTYLQRTEVMEAMPTPPPVATGEPAATPRTIARGTFGEVDFVHKGSGTAEVLVQGDARYLRFEDFSVTNGPDLYVYLAEGTAPTGDLASLGAYANLGRLKGNVGDQNYVIPPGTPESYRTAVIWCQEFGVLFSYAVMR